MNKEELVTAMAAKTGLTKKDTSANVDAFVEAVTSALAKGDKVQLVGFGTFLVKQRDARTGRNPRTGETLNIAAKKAPAFTVGKALADAVN